MKQNIIKILVAGVFIASLSLTSSQVYANSNEIVTHDTTQITDQKIESPIGLESSEDEISVTAIPLWVAFMMKTAGGAVIGEFVSDVYSEVKDYVYKAYTKQSQDINPNTRAIYDINMFGDKFRADLKENYVGDGYTNKTTRVSTLQRALQARGYNPGVIDGKWGKNTKSALRNFQASVGLTADGVCGKGTWAKLSKK